jgi:hypothetical protein
MLQDLGMAPDKAAAESGAMELAMNSPVPTATARDFKGAAPYTATPTKTRTPTRTPRPTITPTNTPRPTSTAKSEPTSTKKPKPTKVEKTKRATATTAGEDHATPRLDDSEMELNPHARSTLDCTDSITVSNLILIDPAPSGGIDFFRLKYKIDDGGHWYIMGDDLAPVSSGYDAEGNWVAVYSGTISVNFEDAWAQTSLILGRGRLASLIPFTTGDYKVALDAYYSDIAENSAHPLIAEYYFAASCAH